MMNWFSRLARFAPAGQMEPALAGAGALGGLLLTATVSRFWLGDNSGLPLLIAPMGASAVLLFALPASPLARPWAVLGGNIVSALVGIACAQLAPGHLLTAPLAAGLAIIIMRLCRCLHPPGGAVALTAVLGGPAILAAGWSFALLPVALNSLLMVAAAWLFHNLTGHRYPHRAAPAVNPAHGAGDAPPRDRVGYTLADIDAVLATYDELLDVSREDLDILFRKVEAQAHRRLHREIRCEDIMSRAVIAARPEEGVGQARDRLLAERLGAMPVLDADGKVLGLVGHAQLVAGAGRLVRDVMQADPQTARPGQPIDELLPVLSGGWHHEVLVVGADGRLAGMITQTDLLAALWRSHVAEQVASTDQAARLAPQPGAA